jgi:hypothetical protein
VYFFKHQGPTSANKKCCRAASVTRRKALRGKGDEYLTNGPVTMRSIMILRNSSRILMS